ncbi:MAG: glycosyltransferase family 2 protein [Acidobacteria bacterium]|nr:glycosyltransferase family 2 protein [Acidobacteriota bacterium]
MAQQPIVTVVTATYNRSNVLAYTIRSVLAQTFPDWELWVIGDCCTDDTETVVKLFNDPRIHFVNLPQNIGEQSGPNNEGMRRARGSYIAFLNHDDLWYPDHLERLVNLIENQGADLVFAPTQRESPGEPRRYYGSVPKGRYQPGTGVPASSWLFRADLFERVGPWRFYRELRNIPSQDWLFRAWRSGCKLMGSRVPGLISFVSGTRPGCYADRHEHEQRHWWQRIQTEPDLRDQLFQAYQTEVGLHPRKWKQTAIRLFRYLVMKAKSGWSYATRIDPKPWIARLKREKPGQFIDTLRHIRGLSPKEHRER